MSAIKDKFMKPRESKELPPEKLREILNGIYPEDISEELMERFGFKKEKENG